MYERATKKVVVDAGHGGEDPGAVGSGLQEKNLNLQAAQYMYKRLQELGIPVAITRNSDATLSRQQRINSALNAFGPSEDVILVSNHINAGGGEGAEIIYGLRNDPTLASLALNNIGEAGQLTRRIYQRRLPENPNLDYYYIIRETSPLESILVEYGFIDNANDANKLRNNLNNYVEGVVRAIAEYANVPYTLPGTSEDTYTVQRGDTLYKIANMFNTSVSELRRINNLTSDILSVGQVLQIRETANLPTTTTIYTVKRGDSLYSIASQYNTNVDTIKRLNNLTSNTILIGQQLQVPSTEIDSDDGIDEDINDNYITYTVVKGDSLWSIAQRFGVRVDDIVNLNNLSTINLQIGDELLIPTTSIEKTYTVQRGDSLWSIARENNTTVDDLKTANNLTSNLLTIGQVLIIPN